jgi:hypothetical protein
MIPILTHPDPRTGLRLGLGTSRRLRTLDSRIVAGSMEVT